MWVYSVVNFRAVRGEILPKILKMPFPPILRHVINYTLNTKLSKLLFSLPKLLLLE